MSCGAYLCSGTSCLTACSSGAQCAPLNHCAASACVGNGGPGAGCNPALGGSDCTSAVCGSNGVCCAAACPDQGAASCGTNGACALATGACQKYPAGDVCAAASCNGNMAEASSKCNGTGTCVPGSTTSCAPFLCAAALVVGAITGGLAVSAKSSLDAAGCTGGFCPASQGSAVSRYDTLRLASGASLVVGGILAAGGVTLAIVASRSRPKPAAAR